MVGREVELFRQSDVVLVHLQPFESKVLVSFSKGLGKSVSYCGSDEIPASAFRHSDKLCELLRVEVLCDRRVNVGLGAHTECEGTLKGFVLCAFLEHHSADGQDFVLLFSLLGKREGTAVLIDSSTLMRCVAGRLWYG